MTQMMTQLSGRLIVVTGAAQGLGRGVALTLSARGANVALWDVNEPKLTALSQQIKQQGRQCVSMLVDITDYVTIRKAVTLTVESLGGIDVLVNSAGVHSSVLFREMSESDWDYVNNVNAKGTFLCCRAVVDAMVARGGGRIINIASDAGKTGHATEAHYAASKHAVIGLTKVLALELAKYNIRVNAICPGYADTPMLRQVFSELAKIEGKSEEQVIREIIATIPVGRIGTPEDIGKAVAFLASDDADYINGQSIGVCGGLEMH